MSKKAVISIALLLVLGGGGYWIYKRNAAAQLPEFRFVTVERGNLTAAVSATGTLSAVTTVQIGTQVSGQIAEIGADFNSQVKKGQLIARIDPTLQQQAVADAQASLDRTRAERERTKLEYERNKRLFDSKVLTEIEFNTAKYAYQVAQASVKSSEVALQRAQRNLDYTNIRSPIDGIVVERTVDVGQTVAASYSTPQLFMIAKDLAQMQILAAVDESDIGRIQREQPVTFSVQAFPDRKFKGVVKQVRLQSKTQENVVNYTVVVGVDNKDRKLLPGMTATLEFETGSASNVLLVPNAALRFRPPEAMLAELRKEMKARDAANGGAGGEAGAASGERQRVRGEQGGGQGNRDLGASGGGNSFGGGFSGRSGGGSGANGGGPAGMRRNGGTGAGSISRLWHLNAEGKLAPLRVKTGISDGQKTEVSGRTLEEGMQIIIGVAQSAQQTNSGPLGPQPPMGGRRGF